jgi:hypothetical protein
MPEAFLASAARNMETMRATAELLGLNLGGVDASVGLRNGITGDRHELKEVTSGRPEVHPFGALCLSSPQLGQRFRP